MPLIDTDVVVDWLRGSTRARRLLERQLSAGTGMISVFTIFEIATGAANRSEMRRLLRDLSKFVVVHPNEEDSRQALDWFAKYHLARGPGTLDCLIAAAAHRLGEELLTLNLRHFACFPGVKVKRPY